MAESIGVRDATKGGSYAIANDRVGIDPGCRG